MEGETKANQEGAEGPQEMSMEGLLKASSEILEKLKKKEVAFVRVVQAVEDKVLVDIGEKHEAVVPLSDFPDNKAPAVGSRIPVMLERKGREDSATLLSYKKAKGLLGWETMQKAFQAKERIKGRIQQAIKGGYLVDFDGVQAFLPLSHSELRGASKPTLAAGSSVKCQILELNAEKRQVVVSRKVVLEEEEKARRTKLLGEIKVNDVALGWVSRVTSAGLVVNTGGLEGLVHVSDVAWKEPEKALQAFKRGQRLKVKVLRIDQETGKVSLGLKQLTPNPGDALKKRFPPKSTVSGQVKSVAAEGAKLALKDGETGFLPAAEYASTGAPKEGETLKAVVTGVHPATFEITLSARKLEDIEDRKRVQQYMKAPPPLTLGQLLAPDEENGG